MCIAVLLQLLPKNYRTFNVVKAMYGVRNLEKTIRFSLKSPPSERFHWPEMSQIKAEISYQREVDFS